jgi:hydrogenase-4 component B
MGANETGMLWLAVAVPLLLLLLWPLAAVRGLLMKLVPMAVLPALLAAFLVPDGTVWEREWLFLGTRLGMDTSGRWLLLLTATLWGLCGQWGLSYLAGDSARARFFGFFLAAMVGNLGLVLAWDAASFYLFFALMSFASFGLVTHGRDGVSMRAGRVYLVLVVVGEVALFASMAMIVAVAGRLWIPVEGGLGLGGIAFGLALLGFGIKAGMVPLHIWLPLAHPVAPTPASAVLSGVMIKAGLIGWLRFLPMGDIGRPGWGMFLFGVGFLGAFYGVLVGLVQRDPKAILAYSSISQMGLMMVAVGAGLMVPGGWEVLEIAVVVYAVHHGLAKGALFLGVGMSGRVGRRSRWLVWIGLAVPALALAGAPFTSGALAKDLLKGGLTIAMGDWAGVVGVVLAASAVGTSLLMVRFLVEVLPRGEAGVGRIALGMWVPWLVLVGAVLVLAVVVLPGWGGWPEYGAGELGLKKEWKSAWPVLVGVVFGLIGWRWGGRWGLVGLVPPGDLLWVLEKLGAWWGRRRYELEVGRAMGVMAEKSKGLMVGVFGWLLAAAWPVRIEEKLSWWSLAGMVFVVMVVGLMALLVAVW